MRRLLVSMALVATLLVFATPSAHACKRTVRVYSSVPVVSSPVVVTRYYEAPVISVPVVVARPLVIGGPVAVTRRRLRTPVTVAVDVGDAVWLATPIGYFSLVSWATDRWLVVC